MNKLDLVYAYNKIYDLLDKEIKELSEFNLENNFTSKACVESIQFISRFKLMEIELTDRVPYFFEIGEPCEIKELKNFN